MALLQINFSCLKLLPDVYEIPNAFIGRILQAEPKKLASVVKPKTRRALGIAVVGFVGDHLTGQGQKGDRIMQNIGLSFI